MRELLAAVLDSTDGRSYTQRCEGCLRRELHNEEATAGITAVNDSSQHQANSREDPNNGGPWREKPAPGLKRVQWKLGYRIGTEAGPMSD